MIATVKKDLPSYAMKRSALWTQIWSSLKNWVSEPDSWVFFHIRKWASNPVLRRTFQLPRALKIILSNWNVPHIMVKSSLHIACYSPKRFTLILDEKISTLDSHSDLVEKSSVRTGFLSVFPRPKMSVKSGFETNFSTSRCSRQLYVHLKQMI